METLSCPFCNSSDIRYSIKTTTISFEKAYYASMYCRNCNTYGPRVLTKKKYLTRSAAEENPELRMMALAAWNKRADTTEHAEWLQTDDFGRKTAIPYCSSCLHTARFTTTGNVDLSHYCYSCGASMKLPNPK